MSRKNSYDFIRFVAATLVIFSHAYALTGHPEPGINSATLGGIAVWTFFILSGYLISKSWDQYPRFNVFFAKRILRITPGLIVATVGVVLATGLFFTSLPPLQFFSNQETLLYLNNIFMYNPSGNLPGVFTDNIYPLATNGSIWTLAYEFTMYIAVAVIGVLNIYRRVSPRTIWAALFVLVLLASIFNFSEVSTYIFYLDINQLLILGLMFFSGVVMHKYEASIKLNTKLGVVAFLLFIGLSVLFPLLTAVLGSVLLAYALFSIGKLDHMSWLSKYGDFSYGLYIYSFPIQQMIASATHTSSPLKMFALSFTLTLIVAATSWYLVESKALKWKNKINTKKYPILQADEAW